MLNMDSIFRNLKNSMMFSVPNMPRPTLTELSKILADFNLSLRHLKPSIAHSYVTLDYRKNIKLGEAMEFFQPKRL